MQFILIKFIIILIISNLKAILNINSYIGVINQRAHFNNALTFLLYTSDAYIK